jgi:signal transduction histidine kinase
MGVQVRRSLDKPASTRVSMKHPVLVTQNSSQLLMSYDANLTEMSYELRTSLNTILMSVELLETQKAAGKDISSTHYLQQIRLAVDKMNDLLDERIEVCTTLSSCA